MKKTRATKTSGHIRTSHRQDSADGRNAVPIAPSAYGVDFVDGGHATTAQSAPPVQLQDDLDEEKLLQGKFGSSGPSEQSATINTGEDNRTGMPQALRSGLEGLSGLDLSEVRVHYNSDKPARLHALACAQGEDIHLGPGHERHLPHEAWHVVQQKQGRVRETGKIAGVPLNDEQRLEREADVMGTKAVRLGAGSSNGPAVPTSRSPSPGGPMPVQRWPFGKKKKKQEDQYPEGLPESDRPAYNLSRTLANREATYGQEREWASGYQPDYNYATFGDEAQVFEEGPARRGMATRVTKKPAAETAKSGLSTASSAVSKGGKLLTAGSHLVGGKADSTYTVAGGIGGGGLGAIGSLVGAGTEAHSIATSDEKKKDKAVRGMDTLSYLASAAHTASAGLVKAAQPGSPGWAGFAKAAAPIAGKVVAPAALAMGSADIISGSVSGGLALHRRRKLKQIEKRGGEYSGIARFAKQSQTTRAVSGFGKALGGASTVLGGVSLLAGLASNPVGWGLLAGAGLIGAGIAAWKKARKHNLGKMMAPGTPFHRQLVNAGIVIRDRDLEISGMGKVKNALKTKSERRYELVRGQIALKLAENEESGLPDPELTAIAARLGIKKPKGREWLSLSGKKRKKRARNYARALQ